MKQGAKYKIFVSCVDEKIVGYIIGGKIVDHPYTDKIYNALDISSPSFAEFYMEIVFVSKDKRKKGISKKLMSRIINYAKNKNTEVWGYILDNEYSIRLCKSLGFKEKKLRKRGYSFCLKL